MSSTATNISLSSSNTSSINATPISSVTSTNATALNNTVPSSSIHTSDSDSKPRYISYTHVRKYISGWFSRKKKWDCNTVIIVTGASSGIGMAIALRYATRKCKIVLASRSLNDLTVIANQCKQLGSEAIPMVCDVTKESDCKNLMDKTIEIFGKIDILVLNAGVGIHNYFSKTKDLSVYKTVMDTNFFGYLHCTKHALEYLKSSKGTIIVVSSLSGEMGLPYRTAYCASKFAITGFFEALRTELDMDLSPGRTKSPIHITIVCPPTVATNLRKNSLTTDASFSHLHDKNAFTAQEVAIVIIDAADRKLRKVYFPLSAYIAVYLRPFLPDVVDYLAKRQAKL